MTSGARWLVVALFAAGCAEKSSERVTLSFVGDILLDSKAGKAISRGEDRFGPTRALLDADFTIGNLECPVATVGAPIDKVYTFRAEPSTLASTSTPSRSPITILATTGATHSKRRCYDFGRQSCRTSAVGMIRSTPTRRSC